MSYAKEFPGEINAPYVAGMESLTLPTSIFESNLSISRANDYNQAFDSFIGEQPYVILMWCPAMTCIYGSGRDYEVKSTDKLGGFIIKQFGFDEIEENFLFKKTFNEVQSIYTMQEVYGSNGTSFSDGGFVWSA